MRNSLTGIAVTAALAMTVVSAQGPSPTSRAPGIEVLPVRGPVFALFGAGGNIVVSAGPDGVLLVDTGQPGAAENVLTAVRELQRDLAFEEIRRARDPRIGPETRSALQDSLNPAAAPRPLRFIINTHLDPEHVGGNAVVKMAGRTFTGGNVAGDLRDVGQGAAILAHENVLSRMGAAEGGRPAAPTAALPTDTYYRGTMKMSHYFNGEGVQLIHVPNATTDGDSIVWFRGSDVIATGDLFELDNYPHIDLEKGGTVGGVIDGLNTIADLAFAEFRTEGGTLVVPGHGRLADLGDVAYYRDMITVIRDRVQGLAMKGQTFEQIRKSRPTLDWDPRYGVANGDRFVEAVYKTLPKPAAPARRGPTE